MPACHFRTLNPMLMAVWLCFQELKVHGVQFVVAPYEADAQMAYLARKGDVQLIVTEDSDLLAYGCPRWVTSNLMLQSSVDPLATSVTQSAARANLCIWINKQS